MSSVRTGATGVNVDIDSINHVGMAVRDLRDTARRYEAMGFQLTPFSPQSAAWKPGEPVKLLGSGNRCAMFAGSYLEILADTDPAVPSERISGFLRHHQGAHIICFNSEHPQRVAARLEAAGAEHSGVIPLQREIDTSEGIRTAKFERVQFAPRASPEGYIQAARHLTPQYIYQPRYCAHANGCQALVDTYLTVGDVAHFAERYRMYTNVVPEVADDRAIFRFASFGRLLIVSPARAAAELPGTLFPPLPGIAAVAFACPDIAAQGNRLETAGFPYLERDGRLIVPAESASGVAVVFQRDAS